MQSQTSTPNGQLQHNKIGDLATFTIQGIGYKAVVLKQGAQLIHFMTAKEDEDNETKLSDNWLWVSQQAEYELGESVRGGVPICWPVFGQFDANPQVVQDSFVDCPFDISQHGYARTQMFELDSFETYLDSAITVDGAVEDKQAHTSQLILRLIQADNQNPHTTPHLDLKVKFTFSEMGFAISLMTQNNGDKTVTFSQALHTYLPTDDITQTTITGFDGISYSDTLMVDSDNANEKVGWQTKTQQGDITFTGEVDRIYHAAPDIMLRTPVQTYYLKAKSSNSTVVWNPWIETAKQVSQFADEDYQRMLCIETANAHLDVVELGVGEVHSMSMRLHRLIRTE